MQKQPRDVVVVRVSEQGDREDENFHSPKAQLARAKVWSEDQGNRVVAAFEEIDVSGKLPLARRPGLLKAIEMVEDSEARAHDATRHASSGHGRCREGAVRRVTECDCLRGRPVSSMKGRVLSRSRYGIVKCECVFGMLDRDGARDGWGFGALPWIGCVVAGRAWPGQAVCVAGGGGRRRLVALDAGG
jgi:hypothetical protein